MALGILLFFGFVFFLVSSGMGKYFFLGLFVISLLYGKTYYLSRSVKLQQRLNDLFPFANVQSLDLLKKEYALLFPLYHKLPGYQKKKFQTQLDNLRAEIECKLKIARKLEQFLADVGEGSISKQVKIYEQIHASYSELPANLQEKYYAEVIQAKNWLEKGRN